MGNVYTNRIVNARETFRARLDYLNAFYGTGRHTANWEIITHYDDATGLGHVVCMAPTTEVYRHKNYGGDKHDVYSGVAMSVFEYMTGLDYKDVSALRDLLNGERIDHKAGEADPVVAFMTRIVEENTSLSRKSVEYAMAKATTENDGKHLIVAVDIPGIREHADAYMKNRRRQLNEHFNEHCKAHVVHASSPKPAECTPCDDIPCLGVIPIREDGPLISEVHRIIPVIHIDELSDLTR